MASLGPNELNLIYVSSIWRQAQCLQLSQLIPSIFDNFNKLKKTCSEVSFLIFIQFLFHSWYPIKDSLIFHWLSPKLNSPWPVYIYIYIYIDTHTYIYIYVYVYIHFCLVCNFPDCWDTMLMHVSQSLTSVSRPWCQIGKLYHNSSCLPVSSTLIFFLACTFWWNTHPQFTRVLAFSELFWVKSWSGKKYYFHMLNSFL